MRSVWTVFVVVSIVVGAIVYALILAPLLFWRAKPGRLPARFSRNVPVEIVSTLVPLAIVAGLFYITDAKESRVDALQPHPFAIVDVTAFRWSWSFDYPGTHVQIAGSPREPPELVLARGETTQIDLRTADVNHSFWVPDFLYKRDAIPGMVNRFDFTPTRTGVFRGACAAFCGLDHTLMTFTVRVVTPPAYRRWIASGGVVRP
ncbi:MAG TPA: cytochrome c oxidase subunit II [Candidatus Tumulicola sp.]